MIFTRVVTSCNAGLPFALICCSCDCDCACSCGHITQKMHISSNFTMQSTSQSPYFDQFRPISQSFSSHVGRVASILLDNHRPIFNMVNRPKAGSNLLVFFWPSRRPAAAVGPGRRPRRQTCKLAASCKIFTNCRLVANCKLFTGRRPAAVFRVSFVFDLRFLIFLIFGGDF
jgi:hypothetical protein